MLQKKKQFTKRQALLNASDKGVSLLPKHFEIAALAQAEFKKYYLDINGWKFAWNSETKVLGRCYYSQKTIALSRYYSLFLPDEENKDTILHEIAHALTYEQFFKDAKEVDSRLHGKMLKDYLGHGIVWETFCRQVGAKPQRCYNGEVRIPDVK
jgi:predicted SprT family Zn-dependent metalloprotease